MIFSICNTYFNIRKFFQFKMMTNGVSNDDVANFDLSPLCAYIHMCHAKTMHHTAPQIWIYVRFSVRTKNNEKHYSLQFHFISLLIRLNKMIMIRIEMQQYIFHWNSILILGILLCYYLCHLQISIV